MALELPPERLWERIQPLLPPEKPAGTRRRPPITNRQALTGILFVLPTGYPWNMIPKELGCGSGSTCFRRFRDWTECDIWQRVHRVLLDELGECDAVDHSWAALDSASVRAIFGGITPGPALRPLQGRLQAPPDHRRRGHSLLIETTPVNVRDDRPLGLMLDRLPVVRKPVSLAGDAGYGFGALIAAVASRGIVPLLAERGRQLHGSALGRPRCVVEQTLACFGHFRRLKVCCEQTGEHFQAFHELADAALCALRPTARSVATLILQWPLSA